MIFNIASWRAGMKSRFTYVAPEEWDEEGKGNGRLGTEIDQYFPEGVTIFSMVNERSWTESDGEGDKPGPIEAIKRQDGGK